MSLTESILLFWIMAALAALPSSSVALVVTRSAMIDVKNGLATVSGVVAGDLVFMTLAVLGMSALAEEMGTLFVLIKYLAAGYLIWFGFGLIRSQYAGLPSPDKDSQVRPTGGSLARSFGAGLLLTLGDVKAIFFYASLLPTFLDLAALTTPDVLWVSVITVLAVGSVKAAYAVAANRLARLSSGFAYGRELKTVAGGLLMSAGGYLIVKS